MNNTDPDRVNVAQLQAVINQFHARISNLESLTQYCIDYADSMTMGGLSTYIRTQQANLNITAAASPSTDQPGEPDAPHDNG